MEFRSRCPVPQSPILNRPSRPVAVPSSSENIVNLCCCCSTPRMTFKSANCHWVNELWQGPSHNWGLIVKSLFSLFTKWYFQWVCTIIRIIMWATAMAAIWFRVRILSVWGRLCCFTITSIASALLGLCDKFGFWNSAHFNCTRYS